MKHSRGFIILTMITVTLLLFSCNAPHDNPFDPKSPNYEMLEEPIVFDAEATSMHFRLSAWLEDFYWLTLTAQFDNPELIDSIWVKVDTLELGKWNSIGISNSGWLQEIYENDLYDQFGILLEGLVGHEMRLFCKDMDGVVTISDPFSLKRIVNLIPTTISPNLADTTLINNHPTLIWEQYIADYNITYAVEIIHVANSGFPSVVYNFNGINSADTTHTVEDALQAVTGEAFYYWTLKVVDDFGNVARSLETQFRIVQDE